MDKDQLEKELRARLNQLREQEQISFVNLGKVLGATEEIEKLISKLGGDGESLSLSPTPAEGNEQA
jgi:hypothetical protein